MNSFDQSKGFTLLELMMVLVVLGIVAAFAMSNYTDSALKGGRSDAYAGLMKIQLLQEQWRVNNLTYGTLTDLDLSSTSEQGLYTLAITGNSATGYTATATATGTSQTRDTDCLTITFTVSTSGESKPPTDCW